MAEDSKKTSDARQRRRQRQYERLNGQRPTHEPIRSSVEAITDGFLILNGDRHCIYSNEAFAAFLKTTPEKLMGRTVQEVFPESRYARFHREFARADEKKTPVKFEEYHDGIGRWFECRCYPTADGGLAVLLYDTTARKQVEAALLESRRALEAAIVGSNAGVWRFDLDPQRPAFQPDYAYISPQLKALIGFKDDELPSSRSAWQSRVLPEDRSRVQEAFQAHAEGRTGIYQVDYRIRHKDESIRWLSSRGKLYHDEYNRPTRWAGIDWDITDRKRLEEELANAKQDWERTFDAVPDLIAIIDPQHRIMRANRAMAQKLGQDPQQCAGSTCHDCIHGSGSPPDFCPHSLTLLDGQEHTAEVYEERLGGYFLVTCTPLFDDRKRVIGSVHVARDITERKRTEETLRQSEERFRRAVESTGGAVTITELDGTIRYANQAFLKLVGYNEQDVAAGTLRRDVLTPREYASVDDETISELIDTGATRVREKEYLTKDGRRVPVLVSGSIMGYGPEGQPQIVAFATDLTPVKQAEEALRESEERFRATYEQAAVGIEMLDFDGHFLRGNSKLSQMLGYSDEELRQRTFAEITNPEDLPNEQPLLDKLLAGEIPSYSIEKRYIHRDGHDVWVRITSSLARTSTPYRMSIIEDITERKEHEEDLRKLNRTLRALSNSNQAMAHAETEQDLLNRVCQIVVHDCGYEMVWIGYAEEDEAKSVRPVAYAGFEEGYIETLQLSWADTERGRGPTGTAIRTGKPSGCADMLTDPQFSPWREEALRRGYASSLALPLLTGGKAFGALTIYAEHPDSFTEDETKLLGELADDLAHGITTIRLRLARQQGEQALKEANTRLQWQTDELQSQAEELQVQAEELHSQTDELTAANQQLQESEQRLRLALEGGRMGRWEWNLRTDSSTWGDRVYELLGLDRSVPASSQAFFSCVDQRDREMVRQVIQQATTQDGDFQVEFRISPPRASGSNDQSPENLKWVALRGKVVRDETDQAARVFGVMYDITQRKEMEEELYRLNGKLEEEVQAQTEELKESVDRLQDEVSRRVLAESQLYARSQMLEAFFQHALTPLAFMDRSFNFVRVNAAFAGASGLEPDFFIGKNYFELYPQEETRTVFEQVVRTRQPYSASAKPRKSDGKSAKAATTYWNWLITPLLNHLGEVEYLVFNLEDVTRHQVALRELQHRARQLQKLTLELSEAEDRERKRLAEILHDDLQQILAAAKFQLGLLSSRARNDPAQQSIIEQVDHMLRDAISKSRSLSHELSPAVLHHDNFADTLGWLASQVQAKHGLLVPVDLVGDVNVQSDALKVFLYKAAQEMLFNVAKHARVSEARIRVRRFAGSSTRQYIGMSVSDRGRGFDPQELRETAGFGLLSIRERVELLGGRMRIKSARGKGSTFYIVVPDGSEDREQMTEDRSPTPEGNGVSRPPSSVIRVLVVDDHEIVREGLASLLGEERGIEVIGEAGNGREAVNLAVRLRPDVVIMDVSMPVMNGDEATRQIKLELPQTRIVALSMFDEKDMVERMHKAGAATYVLKTAPSDELLAAIRGEDADLSPEAG